MKTSLVLLLLAVLGLFWLRHENTNLTRSFTNANEMASKQKTTISILQNQLKTTHRISREKESAQVLQHKELIAANFRAQRREQTITRLLNENEQLRRWYRADLPVAVRRLHQRTACIDAGDCLRRMPEGQSLSDAGK